MSGTALIRYQRLRQDSLGTFFFVSQAMHCETKTLREDAHSHEGKKLRRPRSALECAAAHSIYLAGDELRDKKRSACMDDRNPRQKRRKHK